MHPTPYPDVNVVLFELLGGVQRILESGFRGMYLFGSLTSGDFDQHSDIDVVVMTADEITVDQFQALQQLHACLASSDSPWATQVEVSYIPSHALRRYDPTNVLHPHIDRGKGESLHMMQHGSHWMVQRHTLRERGIAVAGPAVQSLLDPVSANDLRQAMLDLLQGWAMQLLNDPAQITSRGYQSYIVLSLCRMLYTLQHGAVVSKRVAAQWAQERLDRQWAPLIERAWEGRQTPGLQPQLEDVNETLNLIRYVRYQSVCFKRSTRESL